VAPTKAASERTRPICPPRGCSPDYCATYGCEAFNVPPEPNPFVANPRRRHSIGEPVDVQRAMARGVEVVVGAGISVATSMGILVLVMMIVSR
jgi:hypothetical protein